MELSQHVFSFTGICKAAPWDQEATIPLGASTLRTGPMSLGSRTTVSKTPGSQPIRKASEIP